MEREAVGVEEPVRLAKLGVGAAELVPDCEAVVDDVTVIVSDCDCAAVKEAVTEPVTVGLAEPVEDVVTAAEPVPVMEAVCVPVIVLVGDSVVFAVTVVDLLGVAVRVCVPVTLRLAVCDDVLVWMADGEGLAVIDRDIVLDVVLLLEAVLEADCDRVPVAVCVPVRVVVCDPVPTCVTVGDTVGI
jgi:hypothetical protein